MKAGRRLRERRGDWLGTAAVAPAVLRDSLTRTDNVCTAITLVTPQPLFDKPFLPPGDLFALLSFSSQPRRRYILFAGVGRTRCQPRATATVLLIPTTVAVSRT